MNIVRIIVDTLYKELFGSPIFSKHGEVELANGFHEVFIETIVGPEHVTPTSVWLSLKECGCNIPICQGSVNTVGYTVCDNGFTLYANVKSEKLIVKWFVSL